MTSLRCALSPSCLGFDKEKCKHIHLSRHKLGCTEHQGTSSQTRHRHCFIVRWQYDVGLLKVSGDAVQSHQLPRYNA